MEIRRYENFESYQKIASEMVCRKIVSSEFTSLDFLNSETVYKTLMGARILPIYYHVARDDHDPFCFNAQGDWIDLRVLNDTPFPAGEFKLIDFGVSMKLPPTYEAHLLPRSSTFKKYGIIMTNSMGIIDNSYSGTEDYWKFAAYKIELREGIKAKDRIAQFRLEQQMCIPRGTPEEYLKKPNELWFIKCDSLDSTNRGGFGSTGTN